MKLFKNYAGNVLLRNYVRIFSVDVLVKASGFILLPVYLKLMTQEEYGLYGYVMAIIGTFSLVFNLGIYTAQSKLYHDYAAEYRGTVIFTLNVILLTFISGLMILVSVLRVDFPVAAFLFSGVPIDYAAYRPFILLGVVVAVYSVMLVNYFLTSEDLRKVQYFNLLRVVTINVIVLSLLWLLSDADHAWLRIKYATLTELAIIICFAGTYLRRMTFRFDAGVARKAMRIGFPIMISAIIGIFVNLSDRYFIEKYGSLRDMSLYNLAMTFAGIIPFAFASFQNIWLPQFLKEKDSQVNRVRSKKMVIRLAIALTVLSAGILVAFKAMLLTSVIDLKYESILPLLPIVLTTAVLISLTGMYSNHLIYIDKLYIVVVVGVIAAAIGIALNVWLVPMYGIYGAAISSLLINAFFLLSYGVSTRIFYARQPGTR